eukprot:1450968-Heterocapsa_arctica.AAC.1
MLRQIAHAWSPADHRRGDHYAWRGSSLTGRGGDLWQYPYPFFDPYLFAVFVVMGWWRGPGSLLQPRAEVEWDSLDARWDRRA